MSEIKSSTLNLPIPDASRRAFVTLWSSHSANEVELDSTKGVSLTSFLQDGHRQLRTLNWKVNKTIYEKVWTKLVYKSKRYALKTKRVWSRRSSHECPRCGETGVTCKSPEHHHSIPYGH